MSAARSRGQQGDPATASAAVTASQLRAEQGNLSSWKAETGRLLRSEPASSGMSAASAASSALQTPHPSRSKPPGAHGLTTGRVLARHALLSREKGQRGTDFPCLQANKPRRVSGCTLHLRKQQAATDQALEQHPEVGVRHSQQHSALSQAQWSWQRPRQRREGTQRR